MFLKSKTLQVQFFFAVHDRTPYV